MSSTAAPSQVSLDLAELTSAHLDVRGFFRDLAERLKVYVPYDFVKIVLYDPGTNKMRVEVAEGPIADRVTRGELPLTSMSGYIWQRQEPVVIPDIEEFDDTAFPQLKPALRRCGVRSQVHLPLTTARQRLGVLVFGSERIGTYRWEDLDQLRQVAAQVATAVDQAISYESLRSHQERLQQERDRFRLLLDVSTAVSSKLDLNALLQEIFTLLRRLLRHDYTSVALYNPEADHLRLEALDFPSASNPVSIAPGHIIPFENTPTGMVFRTGRPLMLTRDDFTYERFPSEITRLLIAQGIASLCIVPLRAHGRVLGTLTAASLRDKHFSATDLDLFVQVAHQIAIAMDNALAYRQISELKEKLRQEKLYLEGEMRTEHNFEEIVGQSAALRRVLRQVETVAPTQATVLILGETGTGKELIARAIHNLSERRDRTFVRLNCAAIPTGLLESELFGHERGAFTGAVTSKVGRLELAHGGTLFLDEVGEIPLEVQPKLLRALQEKEFERLGSARTIRTDLRLIAATNRDLDQMVADHQFRSDLFYRLNVFPIHMPPLRERPDDIALLVRHFVARFARQMKKAIDRIRPEDMETLTNWHWPGNIRELENFIERAVILTSGSVLDVTASPLSHGSQPSSATVSVPVAVPALGGPANASIPAASAPAPAAPPQSQLLHDAEREHILRVLRETNGVVGGPDGAAQRLGLKRTTLQARMKKLGITRQFR
jgi:formate hydrogenlyase transcriptional activator